VTSSSQVLLLGLASIALGCTASARDESVEPVVAETSAALQGSNQHVYFDAFRECGTARCWEDTVPLSTSRETWVDFNLVAGAQATVEAFIWYYASGDHSEWRLPSFRIYREEASGTLVQLASYTMSSNGTGTHITLPNANGARHLIRFEATPSGELGLHLFCANPNLCTPRRQPDQTCVFAIPSQCDTGLQCASDKGYVTLLQTKGTCRLFNLFRLPDLGL
jgi:hypothetical protein